MTTEFLSRLIPIIRFPSGWHLNIQADSLTLWDGETYMRSRAAWHREPRCQEAYFADYYARKPWIAVTAEFPADLTGLIVGVLDGAPMEPLTDWLIEFGPANLAAGLVACL